MFESIKEVIDSAQKLPQAERQTVYVTWCIVESLRIILTAGVVWSLGKRLLNCATLALKESKRDGP